MSIIKQSKDYLIKFLLGKSSVPSGLFDSREYFRIYGPIHFQYEKVDDFGKYPFLQTLLFRSPTLERAS